MMLSYENKEDVALILKQHSKASFNGDFKPLQNNLLFCDNIIGLKALLYDYSMKGKVDLIYIDPPFATNTKFKIGINKVSTISSSKDDVLAYSDTLTGYEFIEFLRKRLVLLKELLSDEGSIYLHIDYKIGHYVKIVMDEIFGIENFKNDITRIKCNPKNFKRKAYGNIKDLILFYTKTNKAIWNEIKEPYADKDITRLFKKIDSNNRRYTTIPIHAPGETLNGNTSQKWKGLYPPKGRHWRSSLSELDKLEEQGLIEWSSTGNPRKIIYADEKDGKKRQDIWIFKDTQKPIYPTEKNINMLENIIKTSSNKDSIVLDCFSGGGGTLYAAEQCGRKWIGIDNSEESIKVITKRFNKVNKDFNLMKCKIGTHANKVDSVNQMTL